MKRRNFLLGLLSTPLLFWSRASFAAHNFFARPRGATFRLAFGSCLKQEWPQPVWNAITQLRPNVLAMLGDNVYVDSEDMNFMHSCYATLERNPDFARFRQNFPIIATWDDHDYGAPDGGKEYPKKQESKEIMLQFFGEPAESERWKREGIYTSYYFQEQDLRVQVILLDLRWFRGPQLKDEKGFYIPNPDPSASMLGAEQWAWLESELRQPADVRILGSSSRLIAPQYKYERWELLPLEKARLFALIDQLQLKNLVVISGDIHWAEISSEPTPGGIEIFDVASSGLNRFQSASASPNSRRISVFDRDANFGLISIEKVEGKSFVKLEVRDSTGIPRLKHDLIFS